MVNQKSLIDLDFPQLIELLLGYASTPLGREKVLELRPPRERQDILENLETIMEMKAMLQSGTDEFSLEFDPLGEEFKRLRVKDSLLDGPSLRRVEKILRCSRLLKDSFSRRSESYPRLWKIVRGLHPAPLIEERISSSIDEKGEVKDSASERLATLRRRFVVSRTEVLELLEGIKRRLGPEVDTAEGEITLRNGRYVIPLRVSSHIRVAGIVHDRSRSGATLFIEPREAIDLNNALREIELEIYREIDTILRCLASELRPYLDELERNQEILGFLDSVRARARFALEFGGIVPEITNESAIRLVRARHPLLGRGGDDRVIPLDLDLERGERSLLVSGPNAGGKTVLLKTVGLLTLMTHFGILPTLGEGSVIPLLDAIFTGIGDDQSIENDLSTFSARVGVLKEILEKASSRSMILLDEIGSGTDPSEGEALAGAVIDALTERGSLNIFTTHYAGLKTIAGQREGVVNGSLGFDPVRLGPTYRFEKGVPGRSYGLAIAERLGLDRGVIEEARERVPGSHRHLDELIEEWERKRAGILLREAEIERREQALESARLDWEQDRERREIEREEKRLRADEEILEIVRSTRKRMEEVISRLKAAPSPDEGLIKEARREVEGSLREIRQRRLHPLPGEEGIGKREPIRAGDPVRVKNLGEEGIVLSERNREYIVRIGNLHFSLPRSALEKIERMNGEKNGTHVGFGAAVRLPIPSSLSEGMAREIDIRGLTAEDVIFEVQKAIDTALLQGMGNIRFIHGKGKGVLREKVAQVLRAEQRVKSFRLGGFGEGGSGVTIAEIA